MKNIRHRLKTTVPNLKNTFGKIVPLKNWIIDGKEPFKFRVYPLTAETYNRWSHDVKFVLQGEGLLIIWKTIRQPTKNLIWNWTLGARRKQIKW